MIDAKNLGLERKASMTVSQTRSAGMISLQDSLVLAVLFRPPPTTMAPVSGRPVFRVLCGHTDGDMQPLYVLF